MRSGSSSPNGTTSGSGSSHRPFRSDAITRPTGARRNCTRRSSGTGPVSGRVSTEKAAAPTRYSGSISNPSRSASFRAAFKPAHCSSFNDMLGSVRLTTTQLTCGVWHGARSGDRTRMALRPRDFKSLASTSFAIRASGRTVASMVRRGRRLLPSSRRARRRAVSRAPAGAAVCRDSRDRPARPDR